MKTAISIPDPVFESAEQLAKRLGVSRSELYTRAVAELVDKHNHELVTAQLNEVYGQGDDDSCLSHEVAELQQRSIPEERW